MKFQYCLVDDVMGCRETQTFGFELICSSEDLLLVAMAKRTYEEERRFIQRETDNLFKIDQGFVQNMRVARGLLFDARLLKPHANENPRLSANAR